PRAGPVRCTGQRRPAVPCSADSGRGRMSDLTQLEASELAAKIHDREVSSVEVTRAHLDRIAEVDGEYHAFLHTAGEQALAAAAGVDTRPEERRGGEGWRGRWWDDPG